MTGKRGYMTGQGDAGRCGGRGGRVPVGHAGPARHLIERPGPGQDSSAETTRQGRRRGRACTATLTATVTYTLCYVHHTHCSIAATRLSHLSLAPRGAPRTPCHSLRPTNCSSLVHHIALDVAACICHEDLSGTPPSIATAACRGAGGGGRCQHMASSIIPRAAHGAGGCAHSLCPRVRRCPPAAAATAAGSGTRGFHFDPSLRKLSIIPRNLAQNTLQYQKYKELCITVTTAHFITSQKRRHSLHEGESINELPPRPPGCGPPLRRCPVLLRAPGCSSPAWPLLEYDAAPRPASCRAALGTRGAVAAGTPRGGAGPAATAPRHRQESRMRAPRNTHGIKCHAEAASWRRRARPRRDGGRGRGRRAAVPGPPSEQILMNYIWNTKAETINKTRLRSSGKANRAPGRAGRAGADRVGGETAGLGAAGGARLRQS
ncbi:hypothetical protein E2C01_018666 [Portunus trituberculatus]|uniref:Uncharacterized protein n=1 Tax=Portunus trituberculatus TaxID=210409 RepID=A0A5B7DWT8_PORTR|nr:hypothetical protein [Portunus trituberculatus]